ncbi:MULTISPECIES: hypothetical protein [Bacillus]|uniref:hypothetical protein n=1 Tax=Bacillus TaxID=1386 RepID=UPI0006ADDDC6|nr:hypothetical protein [Bacillus gobiensis]
MIFANEKPEELELVTKTTNSDEPIVAGAEYFLNPKYNGTSAAPADAKLNINMRMISAKKSFIVKRITEVK